MVKEIKMEDEERKVLQEELRQQLAMWGLYMIIAGIVVYGFVIILSLIFPSFPETLSLTGAGILYFCLVAYKVFPLIAELNNNVKGVRTECIQDKHMTTKYLYTASLGADISRQPVFKEYFFQIEGKQVWVEEKFYHTFAIGDTVQIHFSLRNGRILNITKD